MHDFLRSPINVHLVTTLEEWQATRPSHPKQNGQYSNKKTPKVSEKLRFNNQTGLIAGFTHKTARRSVADLNNEHENYTLNVTILTRHIHQWQQRNCLPQFNLTNNRRYIPVECRSFHAQALHTMKPGLPVSRSVSESVTHTHTLCHVDATDVKLSSSETNACRQLDVPMSCTTGKSTNRRCDDQCTC